MKLVKKLLCLAMLLAGLLIFNNETVNATSYDCDEACDLGFANCLVTAFYNCDALGTCQTSATDAAYGCVIDHAGCVRGCSDLPEGPPDN